MRGVGGDRSSAATLPDRANGPVAPAGSGRVRGARRRCVEVGIWVGVRDRGNPSVSPGGIFPHVAGSARQGAEWVGEMPGVRQRPGAHSSTRRDARSPARLLLVRATAAVVASADSGRGGGRVCLLRCAGGAGSRRGQVRRRLSHGCRTFAGGGRARFPYSGSFSPLTVESWRCRSARPRPVGLFRIRRLGSTAVSSAARPRGRPGRSARHVRSGFDRGSVRDRGGE